MGVSKSNLRAHLPWAIFFVIIVSAASQVVFTRYVHYHAQNRILKPNDYNARVVTAEDYQSLSDPSGFKPIEDGSKYVMVTTKGTAHHLAYTLSQLIPFLFLGLVGLIVTWPRVDKTG